MKEFKALKDGGISFGHSTIPGGFRPTDSVADKRKEALKDVFPIVAEDEPVEEPYICPKGGDPISEKDEIFIFCHPHIFCFGMGDPNSNRPVKVSFDSWLQWITNESSMIAARDPIFRGHAANVVMRRKACDTGAAFAKQSAKLDGISCAADIDELSAHDKAELEKCLSRWSGKIPNSPQFWHCRKVELECGMEQIDSPVFFDTQSFADTHCPVLHKLIVQSAGLGASRDPYADGPTPSQAYQRRIQNLADYPHIAVCYFHRRQEVFR
jgi:hypothetical protein